MDRRNFLQESAKYATAAMIGSALINEKLRASNSNLFMKTTGTLSNIIRDIIPNYESVTKVVKLKGMEVKVHGFSSGTVSVKNNFRTKKGQGELAKLNILFDKTYTAYLPIWVWVIEHPQGLIVIDTGENVAVQNLDKYLAKESAFMRFQFKNAAKFRVDEKDELNRKFDMVKLRIEDVKLVVLTHLHLDHTDGLKFFPKTEIIVAAYEFKHPNSNMPSTYPTWFNPHTVSYKNNASDIFNAAYPITASGDLLYVPTPGHTLGHSSVIFKTDDFDIFFAGDTSYNQDQLLNHEMAGVNADFKASYQTYNKILAWGRQRPTIYLPTHDEHAGNRLKEGRFIM